MSMNKALQGRNLIITAHLTVSNPSIRSFLRKDAPSWQLRSCRGAGSRATASTDDNQNGKFIFSPPEDARVVLASSLIII